MGKRRWIVPWTGSAEKPAIYHCISRVVERRFALGLDEKEKFRSLMRMYEKFTGCRVLSYCLMDNHIHLLLEIVPHLSASSVALQLLRSGKPVAGVAVQMFTAGQEQPKDLGKTDAGGKLTYDVVRREFEVGRAFYARNTRFRLNVRWDGSPMTIASRAMATSTGPRSASRMARWRTSTCRDLSTATASWGSS